MSYHVFLVDDKCFRFSTDMLNTDDGKTLLELSKKNTNAGNDVTLLTSSSVEVFQVIADHLRGYDVMINDDFRSNEYLVKSVYRDSLRYNVIGLAQSLETMISDNKDLSASTVRNYTTMAVGLLNRFLARYLESKGLTKYVLPIEEILKDEEVQQEIDALTFWSSGRNSYTSLATLIGTKYMTHLMSGPSQDTDKRSAHTDVMASMSTVNKDMDELNDLISGDYLRDALKDDVKDIVKESEPVVPTTTLSEPESDLKQTHDEERFSRSQLVCDEDKCRIVKPFEPIKQDVIKPSNLEELKQELKQKQLLFAKQLTSFEHKQEYPPKIQEDVLSGLQQMLNLVVQQVPEEQVIPAQSNVTVDSDTDDDDDDIIKQMKEIDSDEQYTFTKRR